MLCQVFLALSCIEKYIFVIGSEIRDILEAYEQYLIALFDRKGRWFFGVGESFCLFSQFLNIACWLSLAKLF